MFILTNGPEFETERKFKSWISALTDTIFTPKIKVCVRGEYMLSLDEKCIKYGNVHDKAQKIIWKRNLADYALHSGDKVEFVEFFGMDKYVLITKMGNIYIDGLFHKDVNAFVNVATKNHLDRLENASITIYDQCLPEGFIDIVDVKVENDCLLAKTAGGNTYCLIETDGKELVDYFISQNRFDQAIESAKSLGYDIQPLLKAKWKYEFAHMEFSLESLSQILDKKWVLEVCANDLPNTTPKIRELLKFGLSLTDHLTPEIVEQELENILDGNFQSPDQISPLNFYTFRLKFLTGLDRLNTFEALYNSEISFGKSKTSNFDISREFSRFWTVDLLEFAAQRAFKGEIHSLQLLFTRHGNFLLKYRLFLLDLIPLIMDPSSYYSLLPKIRGSKTVPWNEIPWRRPDWSESKNLQELEAMLNDLPSPLPCEGFPEPVESVSRWFQNRIFELESVGGQTSFAHRLALIGNDNGIDLMQVATILELVSRVNQFGVQITISEFQRLSTFEQLHLLLDGCGTEDISSLLLNDILPYLNQLKIDYEEALLKVLKTKPLQDPEFLIVLADTLNRNGMYKILEMLIRAAIFEDEILPDNYSYWKRFIAVLEDSKSNSPQLATGDGWDETDFDIDIDSKLEELNEIPDYLRELKILVEAGNFFQSNGIVLKINQLRHLKKENGKAFISKMMRQSKVLPFAEVAEWEKALESLIEFNRQGLFGGVTDLDIYTEIVIMALSSGSTNFLTIEFKFAQSVFYPNGGKSVLSPSTIETLVMNAAIDFFDNDQEGDQNKGLMKLSRACCSLLPPSIPAIKAHLNLIEASNVLITHFKLSTDNHNTIMPIQIRLHEDRVKLFRPLFKSNPELYAKESIVSDLKEKLLGIAGESSRTKAYLAAWTAKAALKCKDEDVAYHLCLELLVLLEESEELFTELLSEVEEIFPLIGQQSKDPLSNFTVISKALLLAKNASFSQIIAYWRNSLCALSTNGLPGESIELEYLYNLIEHERKQIAPANFSSVGEAERLHDFYKPLGSSLGQCYNLKTEFEGQRCMFNSMLDCLKLQSSLFALGPSEFPSDILHQHSYIIAKELFCNDAQLSISYLLNCNKDAEELVNFFSSLDPSPIVFSFAEYFFSMKALFLMLEQPFCKLEESDCVSVSLQDLPGIARGLFSTADAVDFPAKELVARLLHYASGFAERTKSSQTFKQREILVDLLGADKTLINTDEEYRKKKIFELSHNGASRVITACLELAALDHIPQPELWLDHTSWLFKQEDNVIADILETTFPMITAQFDLIAKNATPIHKLVFGNSEFATMAFYQVIVEAANFSKFLNDEDLAQLKLRIAIVQDLHSREMPLNLSRLIASKVNNVTGYLSIWEEFGLYMGLINFLNCLNMWILIEPINFFQEDFISDQNPEYLRSKTTSEVVYHYFSSMNWDLFDEFSAKTVLDDVLFTFDSILPNHLTELVYKILGFTQISVELRLMVFDSSKDLFEKSDEILTLKSHLDIISRLEMFKIDGEDIPFECLKVLEDSRGRKDVVLKEIEKLIISKKSINLVRFLCDSFEISAVDMYCRVVFQLLEAGDLHLLEDLVIFLTEDSARTNVVADDDLDGWDIDDDVISPDSDGVFDRETLLKSVQSILKSYTLNSETEHDRRMLVMSLLEKQFVVEATDSTKIQIAKLELILLNTWGLTVADLGTKLPLLLQSLSQKSNNLNEAISLIRVVSIWPEDFGAASVENWEFILNWLCENSFFELLLAIQLLNIHKGLASSKSQLAVFQTLKRQSQLNHSLLYALLSENSSLRDMGLQEFIKLHPNHRSYQITYRTICCLGLFSKLSEPHQKECYLAVIGDRNRECLILVSILLSYRKYGSSPTLCKLWLEIPDRTIYGFRNWVQVERQILESAKEIWFGVVPKTFLEEDFLHKISALGDCSEVFESITLYLIAKIGKKVLDQALDAHYQLDPTSLTQLL